MQSELMASEAERECLGDYLPLLRLDDALSIFVQPNGNPVYENWKGSIEKWVTVPVYRHD
ncbi:uncharacterized protein N7506_004343 [Penicillium brevicompactum]|uniref:uncharacterized protein n=1 Tax=Penicillium brevicompactum TaxID=5074 RepID=UPI0025413E77|nr:uncharacterized protein N7506_004343 [Penicillium brevicompactum]KAJ5336321.1 hypothetical protein N7506_004343 [Penicillium brevicompactum]